MVIYRLRNILIAVTLAVVAALLMTLYVTNYERRVRRGEAHVKVLFAARDIPTGTAAADLIRNHLLVPRDVARRSVVPGALSSRSELAQLVSSQPIYAGEQVTVRRFAPPSERGIRAELHGNMRAVEVPGDQFELLTGTLKAGDHVDVVASLRLADTQDVHASRIVLRDLKVLRAAGDQALPQIKLGSSSSTSGLSVLLAVTDTQVQKLFYVLRNADWTLELRPDTGATDSRESIESLDSLLTDGLQRSQLPAVVRGTG